MTDTLLLAVTIPGDPVAKERPRVNTRTGAVYTPRATKDAERTIGWAVKAAAPGIAPATSPVAVDLLFRCAARGTGLGERHHQDIDNLEKTVLDALNGIAWADDRLVVDLRARVVRDSDDPGTDIRVTALGGGA